MRELPPYPSRAPMGTWVFTFFERWRDLSRILRGAWVIPALLLAGISGMWRRNAVVVLASTMAFGELVLAALGDKPELRYWDPAVPFFVIALGGRCRHGR